MLLKLPGQQKSFYYRFNVWRRFIGVGENPASYYLFLYGCDFYMINHKERVLKSIARESPDRIPVDYWATTSVDKRLMERLGVSDREELLRTRSKKSSGWDSATFTCPQCLTIP